ncbi:MAG TPA: hypothetical protein VFZ34_29360 [Blastocatellia bacterium]|nr:hypothetical protein [Blastocatellia bacterium]
MPQRCGLFFIFNNQEVWMIRFFLVTISLLVLLSPVFAEGKVEAIGALAEASIADPIKAAVEEKGWRVTGDNGKVIAEVWFAKKVDASGKEVMGANFGNIPEGTLLGVIHFPANTSDYRGQAVKAGYYTLRYALILENGAHLGVSPTRDFVLLCSPNDDKDPKPIAPPELIKLSMKASGSGHVSPWNIVLPEAKDGLPKVVKTEEGHVVLDANVSGIHLGLTLIGKTEG